MPCRTRHRSDRAVSEPFSLCVKSIVKQYGFCAICAIRVLKLPHLAHALVVSGDVHQHSRFSRQKVAGVCTCAQSTTLLPGWDVDERIRSRGWEPNPGLKHVSYGFRRSAACRTIACGVRAAVLAWSDSWCVPKPASGSLRWQAASQKCG
jgi:hypothetical protein